MLQQPWSKLCSCHFPIQILPGQCDNNTASSILFATICPSVLLCWLSGHLRTLCACNEPSSQARVTSEKSLLRFPRAQPKNPSDTSVVFCHPEWLTGTACLELTATTSKSNINEVPPHLDRYACQHLAKITAGTFFIVLCETLYF